MKRAVILDRDGVINDNNKNPYVNRPEDLILFDFAAEAVRLLNEHDFLVFVATNQGGVGLKFLTREDLDKIHASMVRELKEQGAIIDDIAACTHAPKAHCDCRKPKPGMLFQLQRTHGFDLSSSYMVGDRQTDVDAGNAAGVKTVFVKSGAESSCHDANHDCANLLEAARWIVDDSLPSTQP